MKTIKIKFQYLGDFYDENYDSLEEMVMALEYLEELEYITFEVAIYDNYWCLAHTTITGEDDLVEWVETMLE